MSRSQICWLLLLCSPLPTSAQAPPRCDAHGFPLPPGACARIGDLHLVQANHITTVALSPDGELIAAGAIDDPFRAPAHDGTRVVSAPSAREPINLWSAASGRILRTLRAPERARKLTFSKNGALLAAALSDGAIHVWHVADGKLRWSFAHSGAEEGRAITVLHFIADDRLLVATDEAQRVHLWCARSGAQVALWQGALLNGQQLAADEECRGVSLSPSGAQMAWLIQARGIDGRQGATILVRDTVSGRLLRQVRWTHSRLLGLRLLDEGQTLLLQPIERRFVPFISFEVFRWTATHILPWQHHVSTVVLDIERGERCRPPTNYRTSDLAIGSWCGIAMVRLGVCGSDYSNTLALAPDAKSIYLKLASLRRVSLVNGQVEAEWTPCPDLLAFSADGRRAAVAQGARLILCDGALRPLAALAEHTAPPVLHFTSAGRLLLVGANGSLIQTWQLHESKLLTSRQQAAIEFNPWVKDSFNAHKTRRAREHSKGISVYDLQSERLLCRLAGTAYQHTPPLRGISLCADGSRVLVVSYSYETSCVQWFDSTSGRELGRTSVDRQDRGTGDEAGVRWYAADGSVLGYVSGAGTLKLLDCGSGQAVELGSGDPPQPPSKDGDDARGQLYGKCYYQAVPFTWLIFSYQWCKRGESLFCICTSWDRRTGQLLRRCTIAAPEHSSSSSDPILAADGFSIILHEVDRLTLYSATNGRKRGELQCGSRVHGAAFSPDGRTLAVSCEDTSVLLYALDRPFVASPLLPLLACTAQQRNQLWHQLGADDAAVIEQVVWALLRAPEVGLALLRERLQPVQPADPQRLHPLLVQLDDARFLQREAASRALVQLGEAALPALRAALQRPGAPQERQQRLSQIIDKLTAEPLDSATLRALEVLERIGSAEARLLLGTLADGYAEARLTCEAQRVLLRLRLKG